MDSGSGFLASAENPPPGLFGLKLKFKSKKTMDSGSPLFKIGSDFLAKAENPPHGHFGLKLTIESEKTMDS